MNARVSSLAVRNLYYNESGHTVVQELESFPSRASSLRSLVMASQKPNYPRYPLDFEKILQHLLSSSVCTRLSTVECLTLEVRKRLVLLLSVSLLLF